MIIIGSKILVYKIPDIVSDDLYFIEYLGLVILVKR